MRTRRAWIGFSLLRSKIGTSTNLARVIAVSEISWDECLLHTMPVDSSRSCSLVVVENHHRDQLSQHHPRAGVAESACPFSLSLVIQQMHLNIVRYFQNNKRTNRNPVAPNRPLKITTTPIT